MRPDITQVELKRLLNYEPETGIFTWRHRTDVRNAWNTRYAGKAAGFDWPVGNMVYRSIRIFDWPFLAHRLAVLYMTGEWPPVLVDHRDLNGLNNKWENLRLATKAQNSANTGPSRQNKTGFKGVSVCSRTGRYRANIQIDGRQTSLGVFATPEEAQARYQAAAIARDGEFARTL